MAFNGPIRVPIQNDNGSLSTPKSHFDAYVSMREKQGNPVAHFSNHGVPEGFHHECRSATNGVGKPIAATHKHLAGSIRDTAPKHVYDKSSMVIA